MFKTKSALRLSLFASIISLLLALTLAMLLLGDYGMSMQNYLHTLIPSTLLGGLIFTLLFTPAMALGLPRQVAALSAGFLFSAGYGMVLATVAAVLGCLITLVLARKLFANKVQDYYPQKLAKVSKFFCQNTFLKALIIRLLPAGSNFLTNILAGTAGSPIKPYVLGSALGFMPQMTIFALMGAGLQVNGQQQLIISIVLLVIALLLSSYLYRKTRHNLTLS